MRGGHRMACGVYNGDRRAVSGVQGRRRGKPSHWSQKRFSFWMPNGSRKYASFAI